MNRTELRLAALERATYQCEFPTCLSAHGLEMAHLQGVQMGGSRYRDTLENVAMLCTIHHDWLDGRLAPNTRRFDNQQVLRAALHRQWKECQ